MAKSYHYITEKERYQIEILLKQKYTVKQIAEALGHEYHTIYHEIRKGTVEQLDSLLAKHCVYKADYAQLMSRRNMSNRGRKLKLSPSSDLVPYIEHMVKKEKYSPAALIRYAADRRLIFDTSVCPRTIYHYFDRGFFPHASWKDLPYKKHKKKDPGTASAVSLNNRLGRSIGTRAESIRQRKDCGHWEMDTVVSGRKGRACLLVLSERMTRREIIRKIPDRKASSVVRALDRLEKEMGSRSFRETFKTVTCDNGVEFLDSAGIEKSCITKRNRTTLYYCHPYSAYERGTNENINRMVRRFYPKGCSFDQVTPEEVKRLEDWINNYPRGIFGGLSSNAFGNMIRRGS